ncbi:MAG: hypothetical protein IJ721_07495 [Bacteroidales bacterium]|nr:hypothetical protein [Bacteroidales bacterium]
MRARYKAFTVSLLLSLTAWGQPYRAAVQESLWAGSRNAAGLRSLEYIDTPLRDYTDASSRNWYGGSRRYSLAELYGSYGDGGFKPLHVGSSVWKAGASACSLTDLPKTTLAGEFRFEQQEGQEMRGSMFIHPGCYPVDVVEFTPGPKTLQTYGLSGRIAHEVSDRWVVGADLGFTSSNYAKRKDIRHTNYALDLGIAPGILYRWHLGDDLDLDFGASYRFRKTSESIDAEQVGSATADSYFAFLDKGMRYGTYQVWDGAGIHLAEAGVGRFPVRETTHGGALQASLSSSLFLEAGYDVSRGEVGEKGYTWFRFPGRQFHTDFAFRTPELDVIKVTYRLHFDTDGQTLDETVLDKVTSGGVTTPEIYGSNTVFRRRTASLRHSVEVDGRNGYAWLRQARLEYGRSRHREYSTLMYPYTDTLGLDTHRLSLSGRFRHRTSREYGLALLGQWSHVHEQGLEALPSDAAPVGEPFRLTADWIRKREYMSAGRFGLQASVRFYLPFPGLYTEVSGSWLHGFRLEYLGTDRWEAGLKLGYAF